VQPDLTLGNKPNVTDIFNYAEQQVKQGSSVIILGAYGETIENLSTEQQVKDFKKKIDNIEELLQR